MSLLHGEVREARRDSDALVFRLSYLPDKGIVESNLSFLSQQVQPLLAAYRPVGTHFKRVET